MRLFIEGGNAGCNSFCNQVRIYVSHMKISDGGLRKEEEYIMTLHRLESSFDHNRIYVIIFFSEKVF